MTASGGRQKVHIVTMGCSKNVVDSEKLMAQLRLNDFELADSIEQADIAVINTCGFIEAAKEESIDAIIDTVRRKGPLLRKNFPRSMPSSGPTTPVPFCVNSVPRRRRNCWGNGF